MHPTGGGGYIFYEDDAMSSVCISLSMYAFGYQNGVFVRCHVKSQGSHRSSSSSVSHPLRCSFRLLEEVHAFEHKTCALCACKQRIRVETRRHHSIRVYLPTILAHDLNARTHARKPARPHAAKLLRARASRRWVFGKRPTEHTHTHSACEFISERISTR